MQNTPVSIAFTLILCAVFLDIPPGSFYNSRSECSFCRKEFSSMKKLLSALLCAMLIGCCAAAETPVFPTPTPEVSSSPEATPAPENPSDAGGIDFTLNGQALHMPFDPDPEYSICKDGYVQASFYVEEADGLLYELYLTFPRTVQAGDTIDPESCIKSGDIASGIMLFVSDTAGNDTCSAATQYLTGSYPEGSSYSIRFDNVSSEGSVYTFAGSVSGKLVEVDERFYATSNINECSADFSFTMDLNASAPAEDRSTPGATEEPSAEVPRLPESTPESEATPQPEKQRPPTPPAQLTTPADAKKI